MKHLYFGHPVNLYDTALEFELLKRIAWRFLGDSIENPNEPEHQKGYDNWKDLSGDGNGMGYFTEILLPKCDGGIFLPFRDGAWGAGVHKEALWFAEKGRPTWKTTVDDVRVLNYDPRDPSLIVLSVEETRARIRDALGNRIPY